MSATDQMDWLEAMDYVPPVETIEHRVVGPPGCGKTTWLARQCQLAAAKYTGEGVAVGSLTRAAATEVAGRKTGIPERNVGTLHAHAYRALDRPTIVETAQGLRAWNEWVGVPRWRISLKHAADPENAQVEAVVTDSDGEELLHAMGVLRQLMTPPDRWPQAVQAFAERWGTFKREHQMMDFTDLIARANAEVDAMPGQPSVIMLDEAQDMSRLEMALARKWGARAEQLVIVGDPDQSLYTWRGADPDTVFGSQAASIKVLEQSYRVPEAVHERAVAWIEQLPDRLPIEYLPRRTVPDDPGSDFARGACDIRPYAWQDPEPLIDAARAEIADGRTVMILASCGYMLHPLTQRLRLDGEPFHNPYRIAHGGWNPLRGASRLLAFQRPSPAVWGDEHRMWTWDDLRLWTEPLQADKTLIRGAKTEIKRRCTPGRFGKTDSDAGEQPGLAAVMDTLVQPAHHDALLDLELDWWEAGLRHGERKTQQFPLAVARRHGAARLRDTPRLIVGSIHSVKGGQADTVYVLPDLSPTAYWDGWKRAPDDEAHKSIVRQFYVAMTRARERLVLCAPSGSEAVSW